MYTYQYPRPALTIDVILIAKEEPYKILLIKRGHEPFIGQWALPGGFVDINETLENAAIRELQEETGVKIKKLNQFKVFDAIDRDPRDRTVSVVFYAFMSKQVNATGADDADEANWFPLTDLPDLGFDHQDIIQQFIRTYLPSI